MRFTFLLPTLFFILLFSSVVTQRVSAAITYTTSSTMDQELLDASSIPGPSLISRVINCIKWIVHNEDPRKAGWLARAREIESLTGQANRVQRLKRMHGLVSEIAGDYPYGDIFKNLLKEIGKKLAKV